MFAHHTHAAKCDEHLGPATIPTRTHKHICYIPHTPVFANNAYACTRRNEAITSVGAGNSNGKQKKTFVLDATE